MYFGTPDHLQAQNGFHDPSEPSRLGSNNSAALSMLLLNGDGDSMISQAPLTNSASSFASYFGCRGHDVPTTWSAEEPKSYRAGSALNSSDDKQSFEMDPPRLLSSSWKGSPSPRMGPYVRSLEGQMEPLSNMNTKLRPSKRSLSTIESPESVASEEPKKKATKTHGLDTQKPRELACPFLRLDPIRHHECTTLTLHRIKDVKQHLRRRHRQPEYYCSRCFKTFINAQQRDDHTRKANCSTRTTPSLPGISEDQQQQLKQSSLRSQDLEEKWFRVWDIIFPGQERPQSVFMDRFREEKMFPLHAVWKSRQKEILDSVLDDSSNGDTIHRGAINEIVNHVLGRLKEETSSYT